MDVRPHLSPSRERGAALIIVLAFVVLFTVLVVAYLSRTTSDRQVTHSSFNQSKGDQIAASGMDLIIGGLRQEITDPINGSTATTVNGVTIYTPKSPANMLPVRWGNPGGLPDPIPNLVRRSVYPDTIPAPGISSHASALNSAPVDPANPKRGDITLARWNKHYLVPKSNAGDDKTDPVPSFVAPDWVILTRASRNPTDPTSPYPVAFSTWDPALADQTPTNNLYAVGRYAYAIYDEGGLLDANVAGYPTGTTTAQAGRKGPVAFADLTALPSPLSQTQIDGIVGWRNYGSIQGTTAFGTFPNFSFTTTFANNYVNNFVLFNPTGFVGTNGVYGVAATNGRTDQIFLSRQQLIAFQKATGFSANALQYLGTFLRELNAPTWQPSTPAGIPAGSTFDYAFQANKPTASTSTAINRDLLAVRVTGIFTRADGTTTAAGDLLIKQRFPLSRINGLGPTGVVTTDSKGNPLNSTINNGFLVQATAPNNGAGGTIQRDFGLQWDGPGGTGWTGTGSTNYRWNYVGASGTTVQSTIERLDQVVAENREPNFFELLKAGILSGSVGLGSGGANTFVAAEAKYLNSDHQIMQIGANIINQWNSGNIPIFFNFNGNELAGIKNLPYLNKLVFKPYWSAAKTPGQYQFDAWLLPSLWNPHQQDPLNPPPAPQNVQIAMTFGTFTASSGSATTSPITGDSTPTQFMTIDASAFGTSPSAPTVSGATAPVDKKLPTSITKTPDNLYYGFHPPSVTGITTAPSGSTTAQPNFPAPATFELQVQVGTKWKAYQKWTGCANSIPIVCAPGSWLGVTTYQDPEFVTLDPRTLRFGVWGNASNQPDASGATDLNTGVLTTLETPAGVYEFIPAAFTALRPHGSAFASSTSKNLYLYANNTDATVHYTDSDTLQRRGDIISSTTTAMLPTDTADRPQILNRPFQSLAELGQVFRDQPWKTLDFGDFIAATVPGPDAGLLDIFALHEASMEAGKTSLNTRQTPVLTAILSNATKRLADGTTAINSTQRNNIVTALVGLQPMVRKTDFLTGTGLADNTTTGPVTGLGTKEARELVLRAFSDAGQTRTWNLMIDVVAQSGRYPPNASSLAGFMVEGEQHYWVHVAIDRFTGQVIDKQIEVVNE